MSAVDPACSDAVETTLGTSGSGPEIDLGMVSNFGRGDRGRETWAYNFIPRLLRRLPTLSLNLFGLREGSPTQRRIYRPRSGAIRS
ncbi:MAG: hypothetical protein ACR2JJ_02900 [Sphingomicrobium sp.]